MDRQIIHIDQDAFFVSVELLKDPELAGKPVIVGGSSDRGVVASCSYEARKFGIHSAMSSRTARQLCPHAIFIGGNMDEYSKYSHMITEILQERVPVLEKASIDEHYIDMTGMDRFHGSMKFAQELRAYAMKETGLPLSFGLSVNKTVAKIVTNECKPNGERQVAAPDVRSFLNPLPVQKIPGLGRAAGLRLNEIGIRDIYTLAQTSGEQLFKVLGKNGISLGQKARGIDDSPVVPYREQKSISTQSTFEADSPDAHKIKQLLTAMVTNLAFQLRSQQKLTACITVIIRYANFETHTQQTRIPYTSLDSFLIVKARELFDKVYDRRRMLRLVGVRLSSLVSGFEQISLYGASEEQYRLCQAMDRIKHRFGEKCIRLASTMNIDL